MRTLTELAKDTAAWNRLSTEEAEIAAAILKNPEGKADLSLAPGVPSASRVICGFGQRTDGMIDVLMANHGEPPHVLDAGVGDERTGLAVMAKELRARRERYAAAGMERVEAPGVRMPPLQPAKPGGPDAPSVRLAPNQLPDGLGAKSTVLDRLTSELRRMSAALERHVGGNDALVETVNKALAGVRDDLAAIAQGIHNRLDVLELLLTPDAGETAPPAPETPAADVPPANGDKPTKPKK